MHLRRLVSGALLFTVLSIGATAPSAAADPLPQRIDSITIVKNTRSCPGSDWTLVDQDLQAGSGWLDSNSYYLCYHRGEGTTRITSIYPVTGLWTEDLGCSGGDIKFTDNLNSGSAQFDYLCYSTSGDYPLIDIDITPWLKSGVDGQRWTLKHDPKRPLREFNTGFIPLLYVYNRDMSQLDKMAGCGNEGENACGFFTDFFWRSGSGACDRGLRQDGDRCVNGYGESARRTTEVDTYLSSADGGWTTWALDNQHDQLAIDEPLNWVEVIHTHNAYNNHADGSMDPNHWYSISDQLRLGARWIDLDLVPFEGYLRLCHTDDNKTGCYPTERFYYNAIKELNNWLNDPANKDGTIIVSFQDSFTADTGDIINPIDAFLGDKLYRPTDWAAVLNCASCTSGNDRWPTRRELLNAGKRVVIISDRSKPDQRYSDTIWNIKPVDQSVDALNFDATTCGDKTDWTKSIRQENWRKWGMIGEDRTAQAPIGPLVGIQSWRGLTTPTNVAQAVACGATKLGLDMFGAAGHTTPRSCRQDLIAITAAEADACASPDKRTAAAVWSWKSGDRGSNGDRAALEAASGRWYSTYGAPGVAKHFVCGQAREGDPVTWGNLMTSQMYVTHAVGEWSQGQAACKTEFNADFAVPVNAVQNGSVKEYLARIKNDASFDKSSLDVWLNYGTTDKGATWSPLHSYPRITPPIVLNASGYPGQQSYGTGDRVWFSLAPTMDPSGNAKTLPLTYKWNFGDGSTGSGLTLEHVYARRGTYLVTITASGLPMVGFTSVLVKVDNGAPTGAISAPRTVNEGSSFDVQVANVNDEADDVTAGIAYALDCDGHGYRDVSASSTLTCQTDDQGTPLRSGQHCVDVAVRLKDQAGAERRLTAPVCFVNVPPTGHANLGPGTLDEDVPFHLSIADVHDPSKADTTAGFRFETDCGDGNVRTGASSADCPPLAAGPHTVRISAIDKDNGRTDYTRTIEVADVAPRGTFVTPPSVGAGQQFVIGVVGASDPNPAAVISYAFDCVTKSKGTSKASTTATAVCRAPAEPGALNAAVVVSDDRGAARRYTAKINVIAGNPPSGSVNVSLDALLDETGSPMRPTTPLLVGLPVTLIGSATTTFAGDPLIGGVLWGDTLPQAGLDRLAGSISASHTFVAAAEFSIEATVTSPHGLGSAKRTVKVLTPAAALIQVRDDLGHLGSTAPGVNANLDRVTTHLLDTPSSRAPVSGSRPTTRPTRSPRCARQSPAWTTLLCTTRPSTSARSSASWR